MPHQMHGGVDVIGKITQSVAAAASTDLVRKGEHDTAIADAKNLANSTGTLSPDRIAAGTVPVAKLSDFTTAVQTMLDALVAGAPGTLNTLDEIAAALGDDPNYAATLTAALAALDGRLDILEAGSSAAPYKTSIGNGSATSFTVTHNFGLTNPYDVQVTVRLISTGQEVFPIVTTPSGNTVLVDFGTTVPTTNQYRVICRAA